MRKTKKERVVFIVMSVLWKVRHRKRLGLGGRMVVVVVVVQACYRNQSATPRNGICVLNG